MTPGNALAPATCILAIVAGLATAAAPPPLSTDDTPANVDSTHGSGAFGTWHVDTAFTIWSAKRLYGSVPTEVTWRPVTSIPLAHTDGNPNTAPDPDWLPLINSPSHPEYPAGHPSQNGAAATILLSHFHRRGQTFTLTTIGQPSRTYTSIAQARSDGNNARVWGGMHYPSTVEISDTVGEAIANYINQNSMQRLHPSPSSLP